MSQKREYDSTLGGEVSLENHVQTYRYAASALQEIKEIVAATEQTPNNSKLVFQTLPKHMRRRAMSHHPKRLPRKYRTIHIAQMAKSGDQRVSKRPSRKYRRRPKNLLLDYVRRQRRNAWLETHIWHARRFHMIERWGYRLARNSCDKTFRACYRATADHCLIQDISFYVCLELQGTLSSLSIGFNELSNNCQTTSFGLSIKAKTFLTGRREGCIDMFRKGCYPAGAICRASFMWRPLRTDDVEAENCNDENLQRTLWLWVHPCVYQTLLEELKNVFDLQLEEVEENHIKTEATEDTRLQFMTKNLAHSRVKHYTNTNSGVTLTDLKDTLNRFRLTGPLSQTVLAHAFKVNSDINESNSNDDCWFGKRLMHDAKFRQRHENQANYWTQCEELSTPATLMSNMILALNIVDPRLQRPKKRTKAVPQQKAQPNLLTLLVNQPPSLADSELWDLKTRHELRQQMMDTQTWCKLREKHALVPGAACAFEAKMQPLPVLLIQRPGNKQKQKRLGYGCGWDVITPAGYGMPIWLTCIMWGAKAGGLRELNTVAREMGTEYHLPDTIGGLERADKRYSECFDKYFRLPPGKRANYRKLAIISPFRAPWSQLVRDWTTNNEIETNSNNFDFFVLRDHAKLSNLREVLQRLKKFPTDESLVPTSKALIQVQLRMKTRGNIGKLALICLPTKRDIKTYFKRLLRQSHDPIHLEPLQPDLNTKERKLARMEHKLKLKRLRAKRIREKRKLQETSTKRILIRPANTETLISDQAIRMRKLWLPDEECATLLSVRKQCSRETFGYVTEASFTFTAATVCAIGYITTEGLKCLLDNCRKQQLKSAMCLVRDTNSQHYYFATMEISEYP